MRIREEIISDLLIDRATTEIEEVDSNFITSNISLLDTIINPNSGDIFLYKSSLTISLDDTTLAGFLVADTYQFE